MTVDEVVQLVLLAKYDKLPARVAQVVVAKLRELETALDRAQARIRELEVGREQR